jgi:hypothetical protein
MALKPCRECGREVSTDAAGCPSCGAPWPARERWTGTGFEWKSKRRLFGIPLIHVAFGRDGQGKIRVAKGFIAVGQFAIGLVTVAQFGIGILFGFGQFMLGLTVVAQFAAALLVGIGQLASGVVTVGQVVVGIYGLCQTGWVKYMWSYTRVDMEAVALYCTIAMRVQEWLGL